jgi:hypothetical protein
MECAINDISMEYDSYDLPPAKWEDIAEELKTKLLLVKDGHVGWTFTAAGLCPGGDTNEPNSAFIIPRCFLIQKAHTPVMTDGKSWDSIVTESFNGSISKRLAIGGWPTTTAKRGSVRQGGGPDNSTILLSPLGFSILRCRFTSSTDFKGLSVLLRDEEFTRVDNDVREINGFRTVCVEVLHRVTKFVWARVYFSADHGYTPVRYEYTSGGRPEINHVVITVNIHSLQKVADGIWFPDIGAIETDDHTHAFQTKGRIIVNQGLGAEDFDIVFPPGTKVHDEIRNLTYTVKPSEEQFDFPQE